MPRNCRFLPPFHGLAPGVALAFLIITTRPGPAPAAFTHTINQVQGIGSTSPIVGLVVTVEGIVTARKPNGFFIQTADAQVDADPNSSEGLFIFTSSTPTASATVGNRVQVTGTVTEFIPSSDPASPPLTELTSPIVVLLSTGNPLPAPISITASDAGPGVPFDQLERWEGMRVSVASLTVVAPTQGTVNETNAVSTTNGIFFGVVTGVARPFREPGIQLPDPLPSGSPCCIPRFDTNPERLRVDSDGQPGVSPVEVASGAVIGGLTGVLDYGVRSYTILPDGAPAWVTPGPPAVPVRLPAADEFTIGALNVQRLFDTVDDPGYSDAVPTAAASQLRFGKLSPAIRDVMRSPDILGLAEVEKLALLQDLAVRVNSDAVAAGQPNPGYVAYLIEGSNPSGVDVCFLVKSPRVTVVAVTQEGALATYVNPTNSLNEILFDRPPLILRATVQPPVGAPFPVTVILAHLRSLTGVDSSTDGLRVRAMRRAQGEFLANLVQARQLADPAEKIAVVGDLNAFEFNDGYVDVVGTMRGAPTPASQVVSASADLVNPDLANLVDGVTPAGRYSYVFNGSALVLDHLLVNQDLLPHAAGLEYGRLGADFPESFRALSGRPERISDHDAVVGYFNFGGTSAVREVDRPGPGLAAPLVWPNPAAGACRIGFTLAVPGTVRLDIFDLAGRPVARLGTGRLAAGQHSMAWDGRDATGARVSAGHYFVRLDVDGQSAVSRLAVID